MYYIDNNKISHHEDEVCTKIADEIESKFQGDLTRTTGKKHTFLGMDIELIGDRKVAITTPQHIEEVLDDFPETLKGNVVNPANSKLFEIVSEAKELDKGRKEVFHSIVQKLLWIPYFYR